MQQPIAVPPFIDEEQRRDFYKKCKRQTRLLLTFSRDETEGIQEVPAFSTLNTDVIPREDFLASLDKHVAKVDLELIRDIWKTIGL